MTADLSIFKAYDIRGIVGKTLTEDVVRDIGRVLGTMAKEKKVDSICVGRDGRLSGLALSTKLMEGIISVGVNVKNIGMVPTPVLYFATKHFGNGSGVAVTGSHNPPDYNGLKMMLAGLTLFGEEIQSIGARVNAGDWKLAEAPGVIEEVDALTPYIDKIVNDVRLARPMKVAVDAGNGVAGPTAVRLLKALGCELVELYTDIDGRFPNHHPDPSKLANLVDLQAVLSSGDAEVGIAFDGDGDRLGVVTRDGNVIFPDRQMMLFSADILEKHPGAQIVYDVKCTRRLIPWVKEHGGEPIISCTGHSLVKAKLRETGALFAGEMSGHLFFNDGRWPGFDDGVYAGMRLLEILSRTNNPSAVLNTLPSAYNTPELQIPVAEGANKKIVSKLQDSLSFPDAVRTITIDGVRTEWEDGFALVRASNTTPVLVLRFEGDTPEALERIKHTFMQAVSQVEPGLTMPQ